MGEIRMGLGVIKPQKHADHFSHVHGHLQIVIDEKVVPAMGYFGEEDVCLNAWFDVLRSVIETFESGKEREYIYDEGEQGQPAFKFELRDKGECAFSIVDSQYGDSGSGIKRWTNKTFKLVDLKKGYKKVTEQFLKEIEKQAPSQLTHWKGIIGNVW